MKSNIKTRWANPDNNLLNTQIFTQLKSFWMLPMAWVLCQWLNSLPSLTKMASIHVLPTLRLSLEDSTTMPTEALPMANSVMPLKCQICINQATMKKNKLKSNKLQNKEDRVSFLKKEKEDNRNMNKKWKEEKQSSKKNKKEENRSISKSLNLKNKEQMPLFLTWVKDLLDWVRLISRNNCWLSIRALMLWICSEKSTHNKEALLLLRTCRNTLVVMNLSPPLHGPISSRDSAEMKMISLVLLIFKGSWEQVQFQAKELVEGVIVRFQILLEIKLTMSS